MQAKSQGESGNLFHEVFLRDLVQMLPQKLLSNPLLQKKKIKKLKEDLHMASFGLQD
jgi:hypothetical protein